MPAEKILVIQTAFLGDAILTLPMIQKLKEFEPNSTVDVVTIPSTAEIFHASPFVNNVIIFDKKGKQKSVLSLVRFIKELRRYQYTKIFCPHRSLRSAFIVFFSGVKATYGYSTSGFKKAYKVLIPYRTDEHEVQRNFDLIGFTYDNQNWRVLPEVTISSQNIEKIEKFLNTNHVANPFAAIAPGSVWNTKIYPKEYYVEIIRYLILNSFSVILIGGNADVNLCREIAAEFDRDIINAAGKFTVVESITLLKKAEILISNDSAPAHMGMCANIPVLTLYCSTVPNFGFFPYSDKSSYLSYDDLDCKPCGIHGLKKCPIETFDCGYKLFPNRVIEKIKDLVYDKNLKS